MEITEDSLSPRRRDGPATDDIAAWFLARMPKGMTRRGLYPKQIEMVQAVLDCPQTSVCGCNSSGKDFTAGRLAIWWIQHWLERDQDAKVVITGPTNRQVEHVVWQNLRSAYVNNGGEYTFGGRLYEVPILRWTEETFIVGFSTDRDYQLQGFHSGHLLVIITEAHGMAQAHMDALHRLNPERMLLTGNPIAETGEFYDSHHGKRDRWHTIDITAYDTPNVIEGKTVIPGLITREDIQNHEINWGREDPRFKMTVLNEWVAGLGNLVVIPRSLAEDGFQNYELGKYPPGEIEVLGIDVARNGLDNSVATSRRGRLAKIIWKYNGNDTMVIADWAHQYLVEHPQCHCVVDGIGVGAGVVDRLRRLGHGVFDFQSGASADDSVHFYNKISEAWWRMRDTFIRGFAVSPDSDLLEQLAGRKYRIMSDRRITLQPKDEVRSEGRPSPDDADSLAMTFALNYNLEGSFRTAFSDADFQTPPEPKPDENHRTLVFSSAAEFREALRDLGISTHQGAASRWHRLGPAGVSRGQRTLSRSGGRDRKDRG